LAIPHPELPTLDDSSTDRLPWNLWQHNALGRWVKEILSLLRASRFGCQLPRVRSRGAGLDFQTNVFLQSADAATHFALLRQMT